MNLVPVLKQAHDLLLQGWTQGVAARDERGERVNALDDDACQWCVTGALERAIWDLYKLSDKEATTLYLMAEDFISRVLEGDGVEGECLYDLPHWNDCEDQTVEDITEVLGQATIRAKEGL